MGVRVMTIHRRIILFVIAVAACCLIGVKFAPAGTLVQMPPAKWKGCKPKGHVTIRHHVGFVSCGGVMAPSCVTWRGKNYVIDLQSDVDACVRGKMLAHEMAHTCGWNHEGMTWERCP
jgi:hypothetical protein